MKNLILTIPVHNEQKILEQNIKIIKNFLDKNFKNDYLIIIANNASTDNTHEIGIQLANKYKDVKYISINKKGRGHALRESWNNYDANIYSYMDVDISTNLNHFPNLINQIQNGLVGSISIDGLGGAQDCIRSLNVTMDNQVERVDYCALTDSLGSPYVVYGDRLLVTVDLELNLNHDSIEWLDDLDAFTANDIDVIVGDSATRHFKIDLPKVEFAPPTVTIPDSGSIPFTATGIKPDLIFSPHGIPSRMTISHLIELVAGKTGALAGRHINGTTFENETEEDKAHL